MAVIVTIKGVDGRAPSLARGLPVTLTWEDKTIAQLTVSNVKARLAEKFPKFTPSRQRLTNGTTKKPLTDESTIAEILFEQGIGGNAAAAEEPEITLYVKDLGPQISWQTVFLTEYAGPLVIHPLVYHLPKLFYGRTFEHSQVQKVAYALVMVHYAKRELETLFVHRFSHATMPLRNIFKNSAHYHLLSGVLLAGGIYGPWYSAPSLVDTRRATPAWVFGWTALFLIAEFLNLQAHLTLRALRPAGSKTRGIPRGGLFSYVSCPNYFAESLAWTAFSALTGSPFAWLFMVVSTGQMMVWAVKKHSAYRKEFGTSYPRRKAMIPFIF